MKKLLLTLVMLLLSAITARAQDVPLSEILIDGEGWKLADDTATGSNLASDEAGTVYFADPTLSKIFSRTADGKLSLLAGHLSVIQAFAGPDAAGRLIVALDDKIISIDRAGKSTTLLDSVGATSIAPLRSGGFFYHAKALGQIMYLDSAAGAKPRVVLDKVWAKPTLLVWPDEGTLVSTEEESNMWAFRIEPDGGRRIRPIKRRRLRG